MSTEILTHPAGAAPAPVITPHSPVPTIRISPDRKSMADCLGYLSELAGSWRGQGFNLIARPDSGQNKQNLYLQLNQTMETLQVDPIGSPIPNRSFGPGQEDISLFGLTYLQKISDVFTGGALHIEPGIWVKQPSTKFPPETAPAGQQLIARMGSIPHGNALLAQGVAAPFTGAPVLQTQHATYNGSVFPSFNSTPFGPGGPINAAGSSDKLTAVPPGFPVYDLTTVTSATNPRSPLGTTDPPLPLSINGVPMQTIVNDPISLLQATIKEQAAQGYKFEGTAINISTQKSLKFFKTPNSTKQTDPTITVNPLNGAGGIENILFLEGETTAAGVPENNADTATVYGTFWIEKVSHPHLPTFLQLQYAQMVVLNFPIFSLLPTVVPLSWPHISVATLVKSFC